MKPLLSELFLPCSRMHSPIRANRYPLTTITGAQRASGQTHSRARSHQGDADLRADRSTAYLVSCIRVRSAHGNSFDHLVGASEQAIRHREAESLRGLEIDASAETRSASVRAWTRFSKAASIRGPCLPSAFEPLAHASFATVMRDYSETIAAKNTACAEAENAQLVAGDSKNTITLARSSADVSPPYGFMLLPGTTSSGFAMKRSSFSLSHTKSAPFMALE
jgi:hypothetical protein